MHAGKDVGRRTARVRPPVADERPLVELSPGQSPSWWSRALKPVEKLLSIDVVNETYAAARGATGWSDFVQRCLDHLHVSYRAVREDLERIPKTGPVVVVANHPFGCIEGIILANLLAQVRPDVKIMANHLLGRIPEMRDLFIFVDPFGGQNAARANIRPMLQSIRLLEEGGILGVFPAGEVAHLTWASRTITDPPWNSTIARIIRKTKATVVPIFFDGRNSTLFQLLGLVHPRIRTAMLAREIKNKRHQRLDVRIGNPIPFAKIKDIIDDQELTSHLRHRTYMLAHREPVSHRPNPAAIAPQPIVEPVPSGLLASEIAALPPNALLVDTPDLAVYVAQAASIPNTLREIGRLRETTFRATGEGTGKPIDLDRFDPHYLHLWVWEKDKHEIVGAYRLGQSDKLRASGGVEALYTHTLFKYDRGLLDKVGPALEMGRSFIRAEYQRSFAPLLLLWKGIGRYVVLNPKYRCLFGPVSISATYQTVSRQLMVQFLQTHHSPADLVQLVRPRNPFRSKTRRLGLGMTDVPTDTDDLSSLIADLEPDHKGIPILLKQYLKLGAKLLAFNVDPDFSDVLDGLIVVDLAKTDARTLERYMGKDGYASFMSNYRPATPAAAVRP